MILPYSISITALEKNFTNIPVEQQKSAQEFISECKNYEEKGSYHTTLAGLNDVELSQVFCLILSEVHEGELPSMLAK